MPYFGLATETRMLHKMKVPEKWGVFMHAVVLTYGEGVLLEMLFASACAIFL